MKNEAIVISCNKDKTNKDKTKKIKFLHYNSHYMT